MTKSTSNKLLIGFRPKDSSQGLSRGTLQELAKHLDMSETGVVHFALAKLARETLPGYEADNGALTEHQVQAIQADANEHMPSGRVLNSSALFK